MPRPVIYEYDPATGQTLATSLAEDLFPVSLADIAEEPAGSAAASEAAPPPPPLPPATPLGPRPLQPADFLRGPAPSPPEPQQRLSEAGKAKVRRAVKKAPTLDDLEEIERALDSGRISGALAARLKLGPADFESQPLPLGAQILNPSGLQKVRTFIEFATDLKKLSEVDQALNAGDVFRLRTMLNLQPQDIRQPGSEPPEPEEEYDPFATAPAPEVQVQEAPKPEPSKKVKKSKKRDQEGALEKLSAYDGAEDQPDKRQKLQEPQELAWPMSWTWLLSRTQQHPEFRQPPMTSDTRWVEEPEASEGDEPLAIAIATSLVYVGDTASGYDPRHLARLAAVDEKGQLLLDLYASPRSKLLDCRSHITGISKEVLESDSIPFEDVQSKLLERLRPRTILVGHCLSADLEALKLWHGPLVDVALLFPVDTRKKYQYHPLRYIGERVLLIAATPEEADRQPLDAVEAARLSMRLAMHEAAQSVPAQPFPPREGSGRELVIRHIPAGWGTSAAKRLHEAVPGIGEVSVRWMLNDLDPTDWRGEAVVFFHHPYARDDVFKSVKGMVDLHVQWQDAPGAPPLGAFLSEQALVEAFSSFGMVVCARIPKRPTTQEPQSFAFISYLEAEDAFRASKKPAVEVPITASWQLELKPRLAKFGNNTDKRVAVKVDEDDVGFDWIHLIKRWRVPTLALLLLGTHSCFPDAAASRQ
ncbi:unnamed protein product [Effrenium voratum]|nr:unnamed protein product [Effrenium voratum]